MTTTIINVERERVTRISLEYFRVAGGWKVPRTGDDLTIGYIARAVFVYRLKEEGLVRSRPKTDGTFAAEKVLYTRNRQGFALASDIDAFKRNGSGILLSDSTIFMAMTPKMVEAKREGKGWMGKGCKRPFDMIRSGRAKVYHCTGFRICTMGGKVVAKWPT